MSDKMTEHAVGAGISFLLGGPIGAIIYMGSTLPKLVNEGKDNGNSDTNYLKEGFRSGSIGDKLPK